MGKANKPRRGHSDDDSKKPRGPKGKKDESAPKRGRKRRDDAPPSNAAPEQPPAPPPPPPPPPAPSSAPISDADDADDWMDGKRCLDLVRHLLSATPKAGESPALAFVLLAGTNAMATTDHVHATAHFECPVSEAPTKVTRVSVESFEALLAGEVKAAAAVEATVLVRWHGLTADIRRVGAEELHTALFDRFEGGPDVAALSVEVPTSEAHGFFDLKALKVVTGWKGEGTVNLFLSASARVLTYTIDEGGITIARGAVAFKGGSLGIRQPSLPGIGGAPRAAHGGAATGTPARSEEPARPSGPFGLPSGYGWCRIECSRSAAWDRLSAADIHDLAPYVIDEERGIVHWGPYPSLVRRVGHLMARLKALGLDPREIECEAPEMFGRALEPGAAAPQLDAGAPGGAPQLGPGGAGEVIDAEIIEDEGESE